MGAGYFVLLVLTTLAGIAWTLYVGASFLVDRINPVPSSYLFDLIIPAGIPIVVIVMLWASYFRSRM